MFEILGYPDRVSHRPGERVRFMVSCETSLEYRAELVRIACGDDSPAGPGMKETVVPGLLGQTIRGRKQISRIGSYLRVEPAPALDLGGDFTVTLLVWPTLPERGAQGLIGRWSGAERRGWQISIEPGGAIEFRVGDGEREAAVMTATPLMARQWYRVTARFDTGRRAMALEQQPLKQFPAGGTAARAQGPSKGVLPAASDLPLLMAAEGTDLDAAHPTHFFNGKLEAPRIFAKLAEDAELARLDTGTVSPAVMDGLVVAWDFGAGIRTERAEDQGRHRLEGRLINLPTRGVTGAHWDGSVMSWPERPAHYAAVHFHEDDFADCGWAPDFELALPPDLPSGLYAARLTAGDIVERITFFVNAALGQAGSPVAFLASSATFMAYANSHYLTDNADMEMKGGFFLVLNEAARFFNERRDLGLSTYDTHLDGSGVCYSSRLRPMQSMRLTDRIWTLRADTHVTDWMTERGIGFDLVTDEAIHCDGLAALAPYRVLVTGTHPEYWTTGMWDVLVEWQSRGGRIMYLGGNGFYWRTAFHPERSSVIEVRRAESGARYWVTEPGEDYLSFSGEHGGLWRRLGRPPQGLVGVGTVATGFDKASYYRRTEESRSPRAAFIFAGVDGDIVGDFGALGGGAAGQEIDCADPLLGTPPHALVLARSEKHSRYFNIVPEETPFHHPTINGEESERCHADLLFYEGPMGGAAFSTGSINWAASLAHNGYDNDVSRITENVLRRFADPAPFALPAAGKGKS